MDNKSEGIVRKMDDLGRVVIPKTLRRDFGMTSKEDESAPCFEVFVVDGGFYLKRRKDLDE
jgi:bifunctional DNA-binding transcriptional regulator/antitoxin component of YhaV-PrlF toxin-antitoxin module